MAIIFNYFYKPVNKLTTLQKNNISYIKFLVIIKLIKFIIR